MDGPDEILPSQSSGGGGGREGEAEGVGRGGGVGRPRLDRKHREREKCEVNLHVALDTKWCALAAYHLALTTSFANWSVISAHF